MKKRVFAMIMAAALCIGLLPTNALAAEEQPASEEEAIEIAETDDSQADDLIINSGDTSGSISISSADETSEEPEVEGETTLTYEGKDYLVTVTYADGTKFPAGAELNVSEYDKDSKTYLDRYEEAAELYGWNENSEEADFDAQTMLDVRLFKIEVDAPNEDGEMESVEPAEKVQTTITYLSAEDEEDGYMVTYFDDDEEDTESLDAEVTEEDDDHNITFETDELSDFMVTGISEEDYGIMTLGVSGSRDYFDFIDMDSTLSAHHGSGVFEPDSGVDYISDNGNYFHIIDSNTKHVSEEHMFDLSYETLDKTSLPDLFSLGYYENGPEGALDLLLLDISSISGGKGTPNADTLDQSVQGDGYTFNNVGTITFKNAGTVAGDIPVDVQMTFDSIRLYNCFSATAQEDGVDINSTVPTDQKFHFANFGTGSESFWISQNYVSSRKTGFENGYSYPVDIDVNMTINIVYAGTNETVDMSFLMAASDIDGYQANQRNGWYKETFKTLSGFNGNYYIYPTDADFIVSNGLGSVTVQAGNSEENYHGDDSYTKGGIYGDTTTGKFQVGYSEGWCGTRVEIYDYTSNDITIQKEDIEDSSILLDGAEFIVYKDVEPGDPDYPYGVGDPNYGDTVKIYYKDELVTSSGTVYAAEWSTNKEEAKKFTTGDDDEGIVIIRCLYPNDNYYLEEVTAPNGYKLLNDPIKFELTTYGTIVCSDTHVKVNEDTLTLTVADVPVKKDIDADGDGEYGDSGKQVNVGDTVEYKIDYTNDHDTEATIKITDVLDEGLDYVEGSATNNGTYDEATRTVSWEFTEEAGVSGSVTFKAIVNETALVKNEVENTATIQVGDDPAVETEPVYTPVPDKDVDADADGNYGDSGEEVAVGDVLEYKIDYQNSYEQPATVTITDVLDDGLTYQSSIPEATVSTDADGHTVLTWTIEDVEAHTGGSVTFKAEVNRKALKENKVTNKATVEIDNDSIVTNEVDNPVPDKDVDADGDGSYGDSGEDVKVGDTLTYIIHYDNEYEEPATVTITDVLDPGLDYVSSDPQAQVSTNSEGRTVLTWTIENVNAHTNGSVTFKATVNKSALIEDEVNNVASVQVNNDPAVDTNVVHNPVPDKDVDADGDGSYGDSGLQVKVGDTLTYKIDYFNGYEIDDEGYTDPATVTITDVLDEGLDFIEASDGGVYDDATRTITWTIENVTAQSGGSVTFKATVNEKALVKNEVDNTASVQINNDEAIDTNTVYNPVPEKDEDADEDEKYGDSGRAVEVGTKITFTIKYHNGYDDPETVTITDKLDEGLTYVEGSATNGGTYDESTRTITWTISNVEAHTGGSVQFSAVVNENALTGHQVENTASVQIGNHPSKDTNTVYNPLTSKDVDIHGDETYGDSGLQVNVGDTLTYIVYYMNSYDDPATVTITDVLDEGLDFVEASDNGTYDADTRTITWTLENVPGREDIEGDLYVTFKATVNENALVKHEVDNTATVQVNNDPSVQTNTVYNPVPEKDVDADGDGEYGDSGELVQIGDTLTYKIDYFNGYDVAVDVVITDTLDPGLTYVSSDPEATYDESTRVLTWTLSGVEALTGGSVTFKATVNSKALENENLEIDNEAYVKVGDDPEVKTNPVDNEVLVIEVSGEKVWDDEDNEYNSRPESITIHLLADGEQAYDYDGNEITATVTPDAEGKWTWTFTNLPKYKTVVDASTGETTKEEITYTVTEDAIPDYTLDGITGDMDDGFVITNKLVEPKISKRVHEDDYERKEESGEHMHDGEDTDGDGEGTWDDADNMQEVTYHLKVTEIKNVLNLIIHDYLEDGLDFEPDTVEITLYDNGDETELVEDTDFTVTQGTCSDPECAMDGCTFEIKFEDDSLFADVSSDAYLAVTYKALTETHEKDYDDYEDDILNATYMTYGSYDLQTLSGMRRSAVAYAETDLFGFGIYKYSIEDGEEVALADAEFILERDGAYATFEVEYDDETGEQYYMVSGWEEDASAAGTLISGEDGVIRIDGLDDDTYTITETKAPAGYEIVDETITVVIDEDGNVTVDGDTGSKEVVTGHEVNVENSQILTNVEGVKTWDDADNQDGKRPESITINLLADGEVIDTKTVTEADGWAWNFTDLPMYKNGVEIIYQIVEYPIPDDYSVSLDGNNVTNHYTPGKTSVAVTKVWDDQGDVDGLRPESVTVELYKNGEATGDTLILSADNNWIGSFTELDEYTEGVKNEYTVKEVAVEGYTTEITGDAESVYVITNTHTPPEKGVDTDGDGTFEDDGVLVHVGDELTYQIKYYNYKDEPATVTITDTLDYALDFVSADNGGKYDESTRTITWTIEDAPAQEWGTVTFKAKVNDIALLEEQIENTATVQIGNDNAIDTNVVKNPTPDETEGGGQPGTTGGGNGGPKTSDTNNIALWIALLIAAMAAVVIALRMRKRS